ncbi:hypothetical protein [Phaffia rhodozyma]|uniref:Uncharacterized protein n=1 Tax=Phaffia rhodozyma TaxID=264483 RepID=A0A0F7SKX0_PHARH|nr:hypothetical protein [Phaffia rhodozyma]
MRLVEASQAAPSPSRHLAIPASLFTFVGLQAAALLPLTFQHVGDPMGTFARILPAGYDRATDGLASSLRVQIATTTGAQAYPVIAILFIGGTLFARNRLKGLPRLQQGLMKLIIYAGLFSHV